MRVSWRLYDPCEVLSPRLRVPPVPPSREEKRKRKGGKGGRNVETHLRRQEVPAMQQSSWQGRRAVVKARRRAWR